MKFTFKPSFDPGLSILFDLQETPGIITFEIIPQKWDSGELGKKENLTLKEKKLLDEINAFNFQAQKRHWVQSQSLTTNNLKMALAIKADLISLIENKVEDKRIILDGITITCELKYGNSNSFLSFRSPENNSFELILVKKVLLFLENTFKDNKSISHIETIEGYFSLKFPMKEFPGNPYVVRLYSSLGYTKEVEQELRERLSKLPHDKSILMDFSNFNGMGTIFYDSFKSFISRNQNIVWVGAGKAKEQMLEMGVNPEKIFESKKDVLL